MRFSVALLCIVAFSCTFTLGRHPGFVLHGKMMPGEMERVQPEGSEFSTQFNDGPVLFQGCPVSGFASFVLIGHQVFFMFLDTGSSTTVVSGPDCTNCNTTNLYEPSTSASMTGYSAKSSYGIGDWTGIGYSDFVTVGGYGVLPTVRMRFGAASSQDTFFTPNRCNPNRAGPGYGSLLGMGPQVLAVQYTDAWTDVLFSNLPDLPQILAFQLCVQNLNATGRFFIGTDGGASARQGSFVYTPLLPISQNLFYKFTITGLQTGTSGDTSQVDFAIDTGTTISVLPASMFNSLVSAVLSQGSTIWTNLGWGNNFFNLPICRQPCFGHPTQTCYSAAQLNAGLPAITMYLNGGQQLVLQATESYLFAYGDSYCSGVQPASPEEANPLYILGASWMASLTVVIDMTANYRVGFAPTAGCPIIGPVPPTGFYNYTFGAASALAPAHPMLMVLGWSLVLLTMALVGGARTL